MYRYLWSLYNFTVYIWLELTQTSLLWLGLPSCRGWSQDTQQIHSGEIFKMGILDQSRSTNHPRGATRDTSPLNWIRQGRRWWYLWEGDNLQRGLMGGWLTCGGAAGREACRNAEVIPATLQWLSNLIVFSFLWIFLNHFSAPSVVCIRLSLQGK